MSDIARLLASVELFQDLGHDDLADLAGLCRKERYSKGQQIIGHKDDSRDVYFVQAGRVGIILFSQSGKEIGFRQLDAVDMFGDIAAIDSNVRSASVIALSNVELAQISSLDFRRLLASHPVVNQRLMERLVRLIRSLTERVYEFSALGVRHRIHAELLRLAKRHMSGDKVANISPIPTHADIAGLVSTHREAVSREFSQLASEGLIERRGQNLVVHDVQKLEDMVFAQDG